MSLSVVIPVKNEENVIENTIKSFDQSWIKTINYELIIVDDFSNDNTLKKIENIKNIYSNILVLKNKKPGLGSAITLGIENSSKKFLAIFMADMSDSLTDLENYYNLMNQDNNLSAVLGSRFLPNSNVTNYPKIKYIINRIANNLVSIIFFYY